MVRTSKAAAETTKVRARKSDATASAADARQAYGAPALEKGLDILELLAGMSRGVSQSEIAQLLGRSLQEVYRVVMVLERRGFIQRRIGEEGYFLSHRLHYLANRHPPLRRLLDIAGPIINSASVEAYQALHVAILDHLDILVVAQVDSPAPLGFRLRVGTQNPAVATASGRVLIAFQRETDQRWAFSQIEKALSAEEAMALEQRIAAISRRGYEMIAGEGLQGITDVSFPILDSEGHAAAVLTMPYLSSARERISFEAACRIQFGAASAITTALGGTLPEPRFPLAPIREKRPPARDH
ncbi:DNA-binding IclR family transcriptional regulator [Devosia subaequoris]|uniref:DNA-binding IclR family transcriptional regulator n=1 Tax=Devosia subaequoris TaxID=395930 RepID=A0A7W6IPW0_9HYPH|nr:IclR family transcriptional regulator [Devosia subaequoris]MBB4053642.1 DNA-binding IclR family transcriptional regulator [Devosia subaequoris]MCP1211223.1 IclR family transcriptional regulator [Devosia subaequoris]